MRHSRGHLRLIGLCAFLLLLSLVSAGPATRHTDIGPSATLYDDACPDLRLASGVDRGGLRAPPPTGDGLTLPEIGALADPSGSVVQSVALGRAAARAPPPSI